jgi:hypothetical protein
LSGSGSSGRTGRRNILIQNLPQRVSQSHGISGSAGVNVIQAGHNIDQVIVHSTDIKAMAEQRAPGGGNFRAQQRKLGVWEHGVALSPHEQEPETLRRSGGNYQYTGS